MERLFRNPLAAATERAGGEVKNKSYTVLIPIAGALAIDVKATSAAAAKEAAWDAYNDKGSGSGDVEWEAYEHLTTGNVLHASQNSVEAVEHRDAKAKP